MLVGSRDEGWQVMPNAKTVIPLSMINCVIRVGAFCRYMNQTTFVLVDYPLLFFTNAWRHHLRRRGLAP
jgi:hypothetical protein